MGVGTSLGSYYDNDHHFAAAQWDHKYDSNDNNVIDPDILNPEDATNSDLNHIEPVTKTPDFLTEVAEYPDIDDRRNQSFLDMMKGYVGEQLTAEKLSAIMQHPLAPVSQTMTANENVPITPLSIDAGVNDIK